MNEKDRRRRQQIRLRTRNNLNEVFSSKRYHPKFFRPNHYFIDRYIDISGSSNRILNYTAVAHHIERVYKPSIIQIAIFKPKNNLPSKLTSHEIYYIDFTWNGFPNKAPNLKGSRLSRETDERITTGIKTATISQSWTLPDTAADPTIILKDPDQPWKESDGNIIDNLQNEWATTKVNSGEEKTTSLTEKVTEYLKKIIETMVPIMITMRPEYQSLTELGKAHPIFDQRQSGIGKNVLKFLGGRKNKKRNLRIRKQRGGVKRWRREPQEYTTKDDMGYFYDCQPTMDNPSNKSKYREDMIITGDRDGNELMLPDEWKIIRMEDSEFYDPQLILVDMALPEGQRGMRWFRRRGQDLCNRGYKPLKRNDAKKGAGRKKKTRKKKKTKKTRKKRGGKDKGIIKHQTVTGEKKEDPAMVPVNDPFATQPTGLQAVNLPIPPTDLLPPIHDAMVHHTHPLVLDQQRATGEFNRALAGVQNHNYYYYTSSDDNSPVQRRPAQLGDHKHIGSYNQREYRRQRSLARRYGEENPVDGGALHDLNTGINKIQELKHAHQYILIRHRGNLPLLEVKKQNGFRLYRERNTTNDNWSAWKSLGNYDFKNRDSGMRGFLRPHPRGVNRTLGRGGKKKNRKTRRKNKRKTKRNKKRKNKKTRKRKY